MYTPPKGLGMWVAFVDKISGGYKHVIENAQHYGIQWIAPRLGQRSRSMNTVKHSYYAQMAKDSGVGWYPWLYNCADSVDAEVKIYSDLVQEGATGIILDAEDNYLNHNREASQLMSALRRSLGDVFIAHAPYSYIDWHLSHFPYREFTAAADAVMDQLYWTEFNEESAQYHIDKTTPMWARFAQQNPSLAKPRCPIGVTYGHELEVEKKPPGELSVGDVEVFLNWCESTAPFYSLYTWEAAKPEVMALLARRKASKMAVAPAPAPEGLVYDVERQMCRIKDGR